MNNAIAIRSYEDLFHLLQSTKSLVSADMRLHFNKHMGLKNILDNDAFSSLLSRVSPRWLELKGPTKSCHFRSNYNFPMECIPSEGTLITPTCQYIFRQVSQQFILEATFDPIFDQFYSHLQPLIPQLRERLWRLY